MSLSNGELSAADVAAVTGNNGGFGGFGDGSFWNARYQCDQQ